MSLPKHLVVLGLSHHRTPLEARERLSLDDTALGQLAEDFLTHPGVREVFVLGTCNRLEVYLSLRREIPTPELLALLAGRIGHPASELAAYTFVQANSSMLAHLFSVAAGLDSQMVGETEILGQLKSAYENARAREWVGPDLGPLVERSFQAAKWARTHTCIGSGQVTIGSVVVDLAQRIFGNLRRQRVLLLGGGDVAERTAQALHSRGVDEITVSSRSFARAEELAHAYEGTALPFEIFATHLHHFDVIISSTAARHTLVGAHQVRQLMRLRKHNPLLFIDVAMPRDIDPAAGAVRQVFLYNLDDLARTANENLEQRHEAIASCQSEMQRRAWQAWLRFFRRDPVAHGADPAPAGEGLSGTLPPGREAAPTPAEPPSGRERSR